MNDEAGAFEQVTREKVLALELQIAKAIESLSENIKGLWHAVESMRTDMHSRLPSWYTFLLTGSWTIIGAMGMFIADHFFK
ncbi:MAG: hypothetical protein Q7U76_13140 [Nitrospirota bacterium]|nr:hypothetical protein [Nitrospirota bacterium]